jgi:hypothetical protein
LAAERVQKVILEAAGLEVQLVNAHYVKQAPAA